MKKDQIENLSLYFYEDNTRSLLNILSSILIILWLQTS